MARPKGSLGSKTKAEILSRALSLFAQFGYAAVSMRTIAQEVGVNVGALYNHFPSKQAILVRLLSDHMEGLLGAWRELEKESSSYTKQLEQFVHFHIDYNIDRRDQVFISFMELRSLEAEGRAVIEKQRQEYENIVRDVIEAGQRQGQFHVEDTHVAAMSVLGALVGLNTWYRAKGRLSKSKIKEFYTALILRSVGYKE